MSYMAKKLASAQKYFIRKSCLQYEPFFLRLRGELSVFYTIIFNYISILYNMSVVFKGS